MSKTDDAWKIHDAQADWTGKVDAKAAFSISVQALLLTGAVFLAEHLERGVEFTFFAVGGVFLAAGVILAALVVAPQLRMWNAEAEATDNFIYFGHARHWDAAKLAKRLKKDELLDQISRQIVVMAQIAWVKHIRVAWSIWLGVLGGLALLVSAVLVGLR